MFRPNVQSLPLLHNIFDRIGASFVHLPLKNGTYHTSLLCRLHCPVLESKLENGERTFLVLRLLMVRVTGVAILTHTYSWLSHDVTKIPSKKLSLLLSFYFHVILEPLKTFIQTNFRFKRVLCFAIQDA